MMIEAAGPIRNTSDEIGFLWFRRYYDQLCWVDDYQMGISDKPTVFGVFSSLTKRRMLTKSTAAQQI